MKKICATIVAGAALASAVPALAQDANATFTGPRAELILGYDASRSGSDADIEGVDDLDQSIDGLLYGGAIGYDIAFNENVVIGAEAEFTESTAKWKAESDAAFNLGRVSAGRDLYIGARAGILASPSTLVYVKGGYTNARYNLLGSDGETELDQSLDTDGWRLGAGVEQAINENTFAKIEYRYSKYGEGEIDFEGDPADSPRFSLDTDRHQVVAAVGVRF